MKRSEIIVTADDQAITATWDVTPSPGRIVADLGRGLTIVRRTPPARGDWIAPYAATCATHGHLRSRADVDQARDEALAHAASHHRADLMAWYMVRRDGLWHAQLPCGRDCDRGPCHPHWITQATAAKLWEVLERVGPVRGDDVTLMSDHAA